MGNTYNKASRIGPMLRAAHERRVRAKDPVTGKWNPGFGPKPCRHCGITLRGLDYLYSTWDKCRNTIACEDRAREGK